MTFYSCIMNIGNGQYKFHTVVFDVAHTLWVTLYIITELVIEAKTSLVKYSGRRLYQYNEDDFRTEF